MFTARMSVMLDSGLDSTWRVSGAWEQAQSELDTDGDDRLMQHCGFMSPGLCCASRLRDETCTLGSRSGRQLQWLHQASGGRLDSEPLSGPGCTGNNVVMARVSIITARASHAAYGFKTRAADSAGPNRQVQKGGQIDGFEGLQALETQYRDSRGESLQPGKSQAVYKSARYAGGGPCPSCETVSAPAISAYLSVTGMISQLLD